MQIEWSHHLFTYWTDWFPFAQDAPYRPERAGLSKHPVQEYLDSLNHRQLDGAVIIQPEPFGDDHRLLLYALALEQTRLRAACLFLPRDPQAPAKLERLVQVEPRIVAARFHAFRGRKPYFASWQDTAVQGLWRLAGSLGLALEAHISPEQAKPMSLLLEKMPSYPVIIDHLGEPGMGSATEFRGILDLARYPNAYLKLSALSRLASELGSDERLQALVAEGASAFGVRRLVWGGGTPEQVHTLLNNFTQAEKELVTGGNLARLLNWKSLGA